MARATLLFFETLIENNWQSSVSGRIQDVSKPPDDAIVKAADKDVSRLTQAHDDIIFIKKGGAQSITPRSLGWVEKKAEAMVTIDIRTQNGRDRLEGTRDGSNNAEDYGGLAGEVERIIDKYRKGHKEFDWIDGYEYIPQSEEVGYGFWRGSWEIRLTELARNINV